MPIEVTGSLPEVNITRDNDNNIVEVNVTLENATKEEQRMLNKIASDLYDKS